MECIFLLKIVQDKGLPALVGFNLRYHCLYKKIKEINENKSSELFQPERYTRDDTFKSQFKHLFNVLEQKEKPLIPLEDGIYISKVAISTHKSSDQKKWIKVG